jgi:hypothetical protein
MGIPSLEARGQVEIWFLEIVSNLDGIPSLEDLKQVNLKIVLKVTQPSFTLVNSHILWQKNENEPNWK